MDDTAKTRATLALCTDTQQHSNFVQTELPDTQLVQTSCVVAELQQLQHTHFAMSQAMAILYV